MDVFKYKNPELASKSLKRQIIVCENVKHKLLTKILQNIKRELESTYCLGINIHKPCKPFVNQK